MDFLTLTGFEEWWVDSQPGFLFTVFFLNYYFFLLIIGSNSSNQIVLNLIFFNVF